MNFRLLLFTVLMISLNQDSFAQGGQCQGCLNDTLNLGPLTHPEGGIYPDTLPDAVANAPYDEDVTFFIPLTFTQGGITADVLNIEIIGVTGTPFGLNWTCSNYPNICLYDPRPNPPTTQYGCIKVCGTPIVPGVYPVEVHVLADAIALGITQNDNPFTYYTQITVLPDTTGTASFSYAPAVGCEPLTVFFETNYPSNGNPNFTYNWDFGNGFQSNIENPVLQQYPIPGNYQVVLNTTIDTINSFTLSEIKVTSASGWNDNGGTCEPSGPDLYYVLTTGGGFSTQGTTVADQFPPVSWSTSYTLFNQQYTLEIWDEDGFFCGADDDLGAVTFAGHSTGTMSLTTSGGAQGTATVELTFTHPVLSFSDTATITVYALPDTPTLAISPNDTVCFGDTVVVSASHGDLFQWYNDTSILVTETNQTLSVIHSGSYWVEITDSLSGCTAVSEPLEFFAAPVPFNPTFYVTGNHLQTQITNFDFQWFKDSVAIPGATLDYYDVTAAGLYQLMIINQHGCSSISNPFYFEPVGVEEFSAIQHFSILPNPVLDYCDLNFVMSLAETINIKLINLLGEVVWRKTMSATAGLQTHRIEMAAFPSGLYHLVLRTKGGEIHRKVLKQ